MNWYLEVLKQYAVFSGRARRKEYWMFTLFSLIVSLILGIAEWILGDVTGADLSIISLLYNLAIMLPSIGVSIRRLHDIDRSGWWLLLSFIPILGWIVLIVFAARDSTPGENEYGPNPKGE
ncbi:DUF805 domain-containing protein [Desulfobulbus sp. F5]|nr:DUF805 domain-containing protein [Desulfobulbus sp. F5]